GYGQAGTSKCRCARGDRLFERRSKIERCQCGAQGREKQPQRSRRPLRGRSTAHAPVGLEEYAGSPQRRSLTAAPAAPAAPTVNAATAMIAHTLPRISIALIHLRRLTMASRSDLNVPA